MVLVIAVLGLSTNFAFVARDVERVEQSQSRNCCLTAKAATVQRLWDRNLHMYQCEMKEYALPWLV